ALQERLHRVEVEVEARPHGEDLVVVGQLAEAALRAVGGARGVAGDELDLAAVDAALVVDVPEVGRGRLLGDLAVLVEVVAVEERAADLDGGVAHARVGRPAVAAGRRRRTARTRALGACGAGSGPSRDLGSRDRRAP